MLLLSLTNGRLTMTDLNLAVQTDIDRRLDRAIYKGGRLHNNELTLTFEKDGKTFDLRIFAENAGLDGGGAAYLTPALRERRI